MIEINGKEYEINTDTKLITEKLAAKIQKDPDNPKNQVYMEHILRDLLLPTPTSGELNEMRRSQREAIFKAFADEMKKLDAETKKKRSLL